MKSSLYLHDKRNMRFNKSLCTLCFIFIFSFLQLNAQLSGTYTIGGAGADYADFTSAVTDLVAEGVDGAVTFNVADGTYTEQVSIPDISGAEFGNSITFKSASEDSTAVTLTFESTGASDNYTLQLDGADNINIEKITIEATGTTYSRAIDMRGTIDGNNIRNCRIISPTSDSEGSDENTVVYYTGANGENWIYNSVIKNGYYGIYSKGQSGELNYINIVNNIIEDQIKIGVRLDSNDESKVSQNMIKISEDQFTSGIYLDGCTKIEISGNEVYAEGTGINTNNSVEGASFEIDIYNNFISCAYCAMSFMENNNASILVRYNNAHVYEKYQDAYTVSIEGFECGNFTFTNNVLTNMSEEYVLNTETGSMTYAGDYNNFYTNGGYLAYYNFQPISDLSGFQSATSDEAHSISVDPYYVSDNDLHVSNPALDGAATTISGIVTDIDGEDRDGSSPDIGADEFDVPTDDVGVISVIHNISTGCTEVQVVVTNFGSSDVSEIPVKVNINTPAGDEILNGTISGTLAQLEKDTLSIGDVTATDGGEYTFTAFTSFVSDGNTNNDTTKVTFTKEDAETIPHEERFTTFTGINNWDAGEGFSHDNTEESLYLGMINSQERTACIFENAIGPVTSTTHLLLKFKAVDVASLDPSINVNINLYECENKVTTLYTINSSNYTPDAYIDLDFTIDEYEGMYVRPQIEVTKNTGDGTWLHAHFDDIIIANAPVVDLGDDKQACTGSTVTLYAGESPSNTYSWHELSAPGTELGTDDTLVVDQPGDYVVIVTEPFFNLSNSDTVNVSFGDTPTANDQSPEICDVDASGVDLTGLEDEITAGTGEGVTWYNDEGLTDEVADPTSVTVTDGQVFYAKVGDGSCTATATVTYTVNTSPSVSGISGSGPTTCGGTDGTITISGLQADTEYEVSYGYNGELIGPSSMSSDGSGDIIISDLDTGTYEGFVITLNGCSSSYFSTVYLEYPPLPTVTFSEVSDVPVDDPAFNLTQGNPAGGTYSGTGITTSPEFDPSLAGVGTHTITYTYTDANECTNSETQTITVVDGPVQVIKENSRQNGFIMHPNPVSDVINISVSEASDLTIYNQTGEKKINIQIDEKIIINCSGMAPGIYIVVVNNCKGTYTKKLVIE